MGVLSWIVVGLIAGWLARRVMRGDGYGLLGDIILGISGALLGGDLAGAVFGITDALNGINVLSIIVALIGAMILIGLSRMFLHPRRI